MSRLGLFFIGVPFGVLFWLFFIVKTKAVIDLNLLLQVKWLPIFIIVTGVALEVGDWLYTKYMEWQYERFVKKLQW